MGEVGHGVLGLDRLRGLAECGRHVAGAHRGRSLFGRQLRELLPQRGAVQLGAIARLPHHLQRVATELGGPVVVGDHRHAAGHLHHVAHAGHRARLGGVERLDRTAEHRGTQHDRGEQAFELHVHAETGLAGDLLRRIQALGRLADQLPVLRVAQLQRIECWRGLLAGVVGEFAVAQARGAGHHRAVLGAQLVDGNLQSRGRRLQQHGPRGGAGLPVAVELGPSGGRAAGTLHAEYRTGVGLVRRTVFDADLRPVGIQFFGDQHRQRGPDALAHLGMRELHGDGVVRRDAEERVRHEGRGRCGRGLLGHGEAARAGHEEADHQAATGQCGGAQEVAARGRSFEVHGTASVERWGRRRPASPHRIRPCRCRPRDAQRRGCAGTCRSGTGCRTAPGRCRYRWATAPWRAGRRPT